MYGTTGGPGAGQPIFTDDVSLQVFMEHLKRLVSIVILSLKSWLMFFSSLFRPWVLKQINMYHFHCFGSGTTYTTCLFLHLFLDLVLLFSTTLWCFM